MNNRQSYLDSMNAGRRRRPSTSLEQLSDTLEELESRIGRSRPERNDPGLRGRTQRLASAASYYEPYDAAPRARPAYASPREQASERYDAPRAAPRATPRRDQRDAGYARSPEAAHDHGVTSELQALREELRNQMSTGLRQEFAKLKDDIEHAVRTAAPASHVEELGVEFERLASMIHKMSGKSDDRHINLLRLEMEQLKGALGTLAREDTVRSFDRRWDELDQRWNDIASHLQQGSRGRGDDAVLDALSARLEQIGDSVKALPTSVSLRSLEDEMKALAGTVDRIAHRQDRLSPDMQATLEDRLDEISRAIAASSVPAPVSSAFDPEPFDRIENRISLLARQLGEVAEDNAATAGLTDQLSALSRRVEDIAHRVDLPDATIDRLAQQIELISHKLDQTPQAPAFDDVFRGIEDRFASLSTMLERRQEDALAHGHSLFRDLERRLEDVSNRIGETRTPTHEAYLIEAMDAHFAELASRIDHRAPAAPADDRTMRELEARLDAISTRIETSTAHPSVDPDLIRSLESQIAGLTAQIAQPSTSAETATLLPRLDQIEQSIASSRHDVVEAARKAAEDAVRSFSPGTGDGLLVAGLVEDLKSLETLTRKSDDRNAKTFEAIHDTLLKIVDRLGAVETAATATRERQFGLRETPSLAPTDEALPLDALEIETAAAGATLAARARRTDATAALEAAAAATDKDETKTAEGASKRFGMLGGLTRAFSSKKGKTDETASAVAEPDLPEMSFDADASADTGTGDTPAIELDAPLDPLIANRPLEPGSGAPDLNAIMRRVRDERSQSGRGGDTDTAKADFIAAARRAAQAAAAEAEVMKRPSDKAGKKEGGNSLLKILKNRRKPVLMGVAAVLMALAALQYGQGMLGRGQSDTEQAAIAETAAPQATETQPDSQPTIVSEAMPSEVAAARVVEPENTASSDETNTDWLNVESAQPIPTEPAPSTAPIAEIESVPMPTEAAIAEIPVEAGPAALREAAASGDPKAFFEIGNRYSEGRGVSADAEKAASWYLKAAEEGLAPAQYRIANMYEKGNGLQRDVAQAKTWYQMAAEQGNAGAMHNLAVLFAMGADGTTDNESAARWFGKAAEFGVVDSQFNLGILAAKGVGTQQNLQEAYKWFALIAKTGDKDAAEKRDEVANALRPEQLETARAAVELWRAKTPNPEANAVEIPESWTESQEATATVDMAQAVRNIQHILNKSGYAAGSADGVMGQKTKTAIAAFQTDNGMEPTGEVDEPLVRALLERR